MKAFTIVNLVISSIGLLFVWSVDALVDYEAVAGWLIIVSVVSIAFSITGLVKGKKETK